MPPDSRSQPFATTDVPNEAWDEAAAEWRKSRERYDGVAPGMDEFPSGPDLGFDDDVSEVLRRANISHLDWQNLRARQLAGSTPDDAVVSGSDGANHLQGGDDGDVISPRNRVQSKPGPIVDPDRVNVFRRGADGKLHPIQGWHTTGPFDFGTWAHDVNWGGVLHDLGEITTDAGLWFDGAGVADAVLKGTATNTGKMTAYAIQSQLRRRGVVPAGHEVHHAVALNGIGRAQESWRNHPAFMKILPKVQHRRIHTSWGGLPRFGPLQRWWVGTPSWTKTVSAWLAFHGIEPLGGLRSTQQPEGMDGPGIPPPL